MKIGPESQAQLDRFGTLWEQGQHVLISGGTGSGKTTLARPVVDQRLKRGGFVVVFVAKPGRDDTIARDYADFTRWKHWHKFARTTERKILLWPDVRKYRTILDVRQAQRDIFADALDKLFRTGLWTVVIDEGLYTTSQQFMNLADQIAMTSNMGRSNSLTLTILTQRPSHLPLVLYSNASHVFASRTTVRKDQERLAELATKETPAEIEAKMNGLQRHQFLWLPVAPYKPAEVVDLSR